MDRGSIAAVRTLFAAGTRNDSEIFNQLIHQTHPPFTAAEVFKALQEVRREDVTKFSTTSNVTATTTSSNSTLTSSDHELNLLQASLLQPNSSLHDITVRGLSPLIYACSIYDEDLGLALVRHGNGVDINEKHDYGYRPLHYACEGCMPRLVQALVEAGANLEHATVDLQLQKGSVQSGGRRPLHFAARSLGMAGTAMVNTLLFGGACPDATDLDGNTPFVVSCIRHGGPFPTPMSPSGSQTSLSLLRALESQASETTTASSSTSSSTTSSSTSSSSLIVIPTPAWLLEKARADQTAANARVHRLWDVPSILREVVTIPTLFTTQECDRLVKEVCAYGNIHGWLSDRHRGYATTDIRSAKINAVDGWLRAALASRLFPLLANKYSYELESFRFRDLFFVRYEAMGQNSVGVHRDGSVLSFNVLLNPASEFDGGGTWFDHTQKTHTIKQGDVLVHSGKLRHAGTQITRGHRYIVVGFVDAGVEENEQLELHFSDRS